MRDPMNHIERFSYNHPNFGIPNLMKYITVANVAFWIMGAINPVFLSYISFDPQAILHGQVWRLVSFMLYPPSSGLLALLAFYFYYWVGSTLQQYWGTPQFNIYFFSGVILTIIFGFVIYFTTGIPIRLTSTYIYLSMFFSFAALFPDMEVLLFFIIPVQMKYLAIFDGIFFIFGIFTNPFPINLLPVVAVLNFLIFCGGDLIRKIRPRKVSKDAVNFRKASREIKKASNQKLYTHKCEVCGRTDTDFPNLEFRYCSRCAGYHCFCEDHINSHIHFTE